MPLKDLKSKGSRPLKDLKRKGSRPLKDLKSKGSGPLKDILLLSLLFKKIGNARPEEGD